MFPKELMIALNEEIGPPELFVGRQKELEFFLNWAFNTKKELSSSYAILARQKKGKTALIQRLYNILYTINDPQIIPFYFKVEETNLSRRQLARVFYQSLLSQYFGYKLRDLSLINTVLPLHELHHLAQKDTHITRDIARMQELLEGSDCALAWGHARNAGRRIAGLKDERIVQIIDEFQFFNEYIYTDETYQQKIELASSYQGTAESKTSPLLITGSYIGWLSAIIGKMVARYRSYHLGNLSDEDALAAVYNYANLLELKITDDVASYIAGICEHDPFYVSAVIRSQHEEKDLTSRESVLKVLKYETSYPDGEIAKVWLEYLWSAFERVNDKNAKKIVLYLAKHGDEIRNREQILKDLSLTMDDGELEQKLHKLVRADIIARGPTNYDYKGLGDHIFELCFRKVYEREIENISVAEIETDVIKKFSSSRKEVSHYKGRLAEFRVLSRLLAAALYGVPLAEIVYNPVKDLAFGRFRFMHKEVFHIDHDTEVEVDIFCAGEGEDGVDFAVEVKDWETPVTIETVKQFIVKKNLLEKIRRRKTGYIFYSEKGVSEKIRQLLEQNGIMCSDGEKLKEYTAERRD